MLSDLREVSSDTTVFINSNDENYGQSTTTADVNITGGMSLRVSFLAAPDEIRQSSSGEILSVTIGCQL